MIGILILILIVIGVLLGRNMLLPAAILAAIFPASSVLNVSGSNSVSVAPFWLVVVLICAYMGFSFLLARRQQPRTLRLEIFALLLTFYWALAVSAVGPLLFAGIGVFSPRGGIDDQVNNLASLRFGISNVAQMLYATLLVGFILYASTRGREHLRWVQVAVIVVATFGLYQFIADLYHLPFPNALVFNNQGVAIGNNQRIGEFLRINSTFTEPSTAGAFFAAGAVAMLAAGAHVLSIVCVLGVLLSTSSTGYITLILAGGIFLGWKFYLKVRRRTFPAIFTVTILLLVIVGAVLIYLLGLGEILLASTINKTGSRSFNNRTASDIYSLALTLKTFGIGVGLGSNRPSSFITALVSSIGIPGLLLFLASVILVLRRRGASWAKWGLFTYLIAKSLAVPDFNDPWLWIWFSLALATTDPRPRPVKLPTMVSTHPRGIKHENTPYFE